MINHLINYSRGILLEIIELLYEQLHKGSENKVQDIQEKGGLELYVKSRNKEKNKTL